MIGVLRLFTLLIYHNLTVFTANNETLGIYNDALNEEAFTWALTKQHLIVTGALEQHDLALVRAHNQTAIGHPCVAGEIVRDVGLFLGDLIVCLLQRVVLLDSEELIGVISSYHNDIMIGCVEGAVEWFHVLSRADALEGETLLLVPVPQNDFVAVFSGQGGEEGLLS